jgi:glutamate---cysteine ligase / carboxylate-amine ligase
VIFSRWPVSGTPPHFPDINDHDRRVQPLLTAA